MDNVEMLKEYKQLLDEGIISQEEFEAKKKAILEAPVVPAAPAGGYSQAQSGQYSGAGYNYNAANSNAASSSGMSAKATSILSYFGLILWLVAYLAGDKEGAKFHLNQSLVINLAGLLSIIPLIGLFWAIFIFVVWIMGLVYAINQEEKEVPLIGKFRILS